MAWRPSFKKRSPLITIPSALRAFPPSLRNWAPLRLTFPSTVAEEANFAKGFEFSVLGVSVQVDVTPDL